MLNIRLGHGLEGLHPSLTNGPGWRVCLWTQGCSLLCTSRCLNPHFLSEKGGWLFPVDELLARVREVAHREPRSEGITVLGGEPFDQAPALVGLLRGVRKSGLSTMVYTGHVYEELIAQGDPAVRQSIELIDVLVDGPYVEEQYNGGIAWRGSTNQRLLCLSGRYMKEDLDAASSGQGKAFSIQLHPTGAISASGLQERRAAARLESGLLRPLREL